MVITELNKFISMLFGKADEQSCGHGENNIASCCYCVERGFPWFQMDVSKQTL